MENVKSQIPHLTGPLVRTDLKKFQSSSVRANLSSSSDHRINVFPDTLYQSCYHFLEFKRMVISLALYTELVNQSVLRSSTPPVRTSGVSGTDYPEDAKPSGWVYHF